jgi:hypothetical protein
VRRKEVFDFDAIMAFQQARMASDQYSYFYKLIDDRDIGVHPEVTEAVQALSLDPRCGPGTPFGDLVALISGRLLQVEVQQRAKAEEIVPKLQELVSKAETAKSLMFGSAEGIIPRPAVFRDQKKRPSIQSPKDSATRTSSFKLPDS